MFLCDYHLHTTNSTDGKSSLTDMCRAAVSKGIKEIAVTDHFEPTENDKSYAFYERDLFYSDIEDVRKIFKGMLVIRYGVELGQPHIYPEYSEKLINEYPFDFVLASCHKMTGDIDFADINYARADLRRYFEKYLDNLKELLAWGQFDCIGHFDLVKRYCARDGIKINLMDNYKDEIADILKLIAEKNKGIEINTSGLRQFSAGFMPGFDIVSLYRMLGGKIITVGSDAHSAEEVGKGIDDAIALAFDAGFKNITVFEKRVPKFIDISELSRKTA